MSRSAKLRLSDILKPYFLLSFLKNYNIIWCFYFWRVLLVITNLLFMIIRHCLPIYTYPPIHFSKIDVTTKNSGGFIRFSLIFWLRVINSKK